jgi:hypothetical protein
MDREMIERHLAQARRHVTEGEQHVARQRNLLAELPRDGHDTTEAAKLLENFEDLQRMHVADSDRLERELAQLS